MFGREKLIHHGGTVLRPITRLQEVNRILLAYPANVSFTGKTVHHDDNNFQVDTFLRCLDPRRPDIVRCHGTLWTRYAEIEGHWDNDLLEIKSIKMGQVELKGGPKEEKVYVGGIEIPNAIIQQGFFSFQYGSLEVTVNLDSGGTFDIRCRTNHFCLLVASRMGKVRGKIISFLPEVTCLLGTMIDNLTGATWEVRLEPAITCIYNETDKYTVTTDTFIKYLGPDKTFADLLIMCENTELKSKADIYFDNEIRIPFALPKGIGYLTRRVGLGLLSVDIDTLSGSEYRRAGYKTKELKQFLSDMGVPFSTKETKKGLQELIMAYYKAYRELTNAGKNFDLGTLQERKEVESLTDIVRKNS